MGLADKIKFTKDINITLISFQLYNAVISLLTVLPPPDALLLLESKTLMHVAGDFSLLLSPPKDILLPMEPKAPILVAEAVFSQLQQIV